jgi:hypothetical protein
VTVHNVAGNNDNRHRQALGTLNRTGLCVGPVDFVKGPGRHSFQLIRNDIGELALNFNGKFDLPEDANVMRKNQVNSRSRDVTLLLEVGQTLLLLGRRQRAKTGDLEAVEKASPVQKRPDDRNTERAANYFDPGTGLR